ncbi:MAG: hypothetical protein ACI94Y_003091 [Maribacter sp.]|jgi:uncharacterized protein YigE (DUF2233 family)
MKNKSSFYHIVILLVIGLMCCNTYSFAQEELGSIETKKKCKKDAKCWTDEYNKLVTEHHVILRQKKRLDTFYDDERTKNIKLQKKYDELLATKTGSQAAPPKKIISIAGDDCDKRIQALRDSFNGVIKHTELLAENNSKNKKCDKEISNLESAKARLEAENRDLKNKNKEVEKQVKEVKDRYSQATKVNQKYYKDPTYKNESINFTGHNFETFVVTEPSLIDIKIYKRNDRDKKLASLLDLNKHIEKKGGEVLFSTNGGMYNSIRESQGYLVLNGEEIKKIDTSDPKDGTNFYLKPNGVFYIDDQGKAGVLETDVYKKQKIEPKYATQSGPMLVVDGKIHPILNPFGKSKKIRSGVGVDKEGEVFFAISNEPVNFHTFAYLFQKEFNCENALFLDGTVSKTYSKHGKKELGGDFGPMIAVLHKKAPKQVQPEDLKQREQPQPNTEEGKIDSSQEKK